MTSSDDHATAVQTLLADERPEPDDKPSVVGSLQRLCRAARRDLPAIGVGLSLISESGDLMTAAASSPAIALVEELQFTLGEGPCLAAFSSREPVLVPNLSRSATRWPGYGPAAHSHGVRAVFAFPLHAGRVLLGALDVYRDHPGELSGWGQARAGTYAAVAVRTMLQTQGDTSDTASLLLDGEDARFEVYQAQGMVMFQLDVGPEEALSRMRAHAYTNDRRLRDVADDIIARRLTLEPDNPGS